MKFITKAEKKALRFGIMLGRSTAKTSKKAKPSPTKNGATHASKMSKPQFGGSTFVNGKFFDTNFKIPKEISRETIKKLRREYDYDGKQTDKDIVEAYVGHMRHKYGQFDKDGVFQGLLGED